MNKRVLITILITALAATLLIGACKKRNRGGSGDEKDPDSQAKPKYVSKGDEGTITGVIKFDGTPPAPKRIDMGADPNCLTGGGNAMTEDVVIADGKLANVFVYLKGGPVDNNEFPTPSAQASLDQLGCRYEPRIFGIQTNQALKITNSDKATHNIHPTPRANPEWNESQPAGAAPKEKKFARAEILIPVKCNVHPWMKAYIGVLAHPCFTVSSKDGTFTIKDVPPGTYTLIAWHETLGEQKQQITVGKSESKTQDFTYKSGTAYAPTSLTIAPALVLP